MASANALSGKANLVASLRELIGTTQGYRNRNSLSFSLLSPGIPTGALSEICGPGKTEFLVRFLAEHSKLRVAWIEEKISVYPYAIFQKQARLERVLFAETGTNSFWALTQVLRSQAFGVIVFSSTTTPQGKWGKGGTGQAFGRQKFDERALRALQLAAEKSQTALIFLSDEPTHAWPVALQVQVERGASFSSKERAVPLPGREGRREGPENFSDLTVRVSRRA